MKFYQFLSRNILGGLFSANNPSSTNPFLTASSAVGSDTQPYFYRRANLISANAMIVSSLNNDQLSSTDIGYPIPEDSSLESVIVVFGQVQSVQIVEIPIELRVHGNNIPNQPSVTTGALIPSSTNCSIPGGVNTYNLLYVFPLNLDFSPYANDLLTINTGNFDLRGAVISDCLVVIKFRKNA